MGGYTVAVAVNAQGMYAGKRRKTWSVQENYQCGRPTAASAAQDG